MLSDGKLLGFSLTFILIIAVVRVTFIAFPLARSVVCVPPAWRLPALFSISNLLWHLRGGPYYCTHTDRLIKCTVG